MGKLGVVKDLRVHIGVCPLGVFAYSDAGDLLGYELFPWDVGQAADRLERVLRGEWVEELDSLVGLLEPETVVLEDKTLAEGVKRFGRGFGVEVVVPNVAGEEIRSGVSTLASLVGKDEKDVWRFFSGVMIELARRKIRKASAERDKWVMQGVEALDDCDRVLNLLYSRLREWYGLHFPELEGLISDPLRYAEFVVRVGDRSRVEECWEDRDVVEAAKRSVGADIEEEDLKVVQMLAKRIVDLFGDRDMLVGYIEDVMVQVAPNLSVVAGPLLGARLISLAGGVGRLAKMPASTVQVLGAEKALFKHLRHGRKPPKHGVIYQYPAIRGSPRKLRGRIARALAGKICIAARCDAYSGVFLGDELEKGLLERIERIKGG